MSATEVPVAYPLTANAVLIPIFAGVGIFCNIVPLVILFRVKNLAAVTMIGTNMLINIWTFINACIWPTDDFASWWKGVGLCDIESTLRTPLYTLLALAVCVLTRDLARAVDVDNPRLFETPAKRRRRILFDVLCIFGLPLIQLPLHYVVQYNRYSIIAIYGCVDLLDNSWPRIVLLSMWPMLIGLLNCYYSLLTIFRLRKHRGRLSSTLSRTGSGLDARKFLKLFAMTSVVLIIYLPVICYFFYTNIPNPFVAYSWSRIHNPVVWKYVIYFHTADYPDVQYWPWVPIGLAFILFFWYGLTHEAIECYRRFLVVCGLGKFWPTLKEPYQRKRNTRATMSTRQSWVAKFDMLEKAANYLDGNKQKSQGSQATASTGTSNDDRNKKNNKSSTSNDPDIISPVSSSSYSAEKKFGSEVLEIETPEPVATNPPTNRGFFSAFKTHINLPVPLFTSSSNKSAKPSQAPHTSVDNHDLEKQADTIDTQHAFTTDNTVETNIWSSRSVDEEEHVDPASPEMGTRAYRERERREKDRRESREKNGMTGMVADIVRVGELPIQGLEPENGYGGVEVKRSLVQREEACSKP